MWHSPGKWRTGVTVRRGETEAEGGSSRFTRLVAGRAGPGGLEQDLGRKTWAPTRPCGQVGGTGPAGSRRVPGGGRPQPPFLRPLGPGPAVIILVRLPRSLSEHWGPLATAEAPEGREGSAQ